MSIKKHKVDTSLERQILIGMIISDNFLKQVIPMYMPDLFEITYSGTIAKWCIRHYDKYGKAPNILIEDIFDTWKKTSDNDEQTEYIKGFLSTLSDEYERGDKFNDDYIFDKTVRHFKSRSLKLLSEDIEACLKHNDVDEAEKCYQDYKKVEKITSNGIDIFDDEDAWRNAFDINTDILFTVPGALGKMLNGNFVRDSLIGIMGIAKIGKSWWMQFLGIQAVKARCNVAVFQLGDLSEGQSMVRTGVYITKRSNKPKYCKELFVPVMDCYHNQHGTCEYRRRRTNTVSLLDSDNNLMEFNEAEKLGYSVCIDCENEKWFKGAVWHVRRRPVRPLTWQEAFKEAQAYKAKIKAKRYKISTHPSKSLSVSGMETILDSWERIEGFIPDVVICDYADLFAPERKGTKESRDDINETWMALSALRQKRKICIITATQANGMAIKEKSISREHYSNDRRKYDHVTAMFGLSQTNEEKRNGITRWGTIVLREDDWDTEAFVNVIGCLSIGRSYIDSW